MRIPVRALWAALSLLPMPLLPCQNERPPESFQVALGLQQRGLFDEAARHFEDFLKTGATHALAAEASYRLGACRAELGQADAAVAALRQSLQRGAGGFALRPECRYRLGNLLEAKGDHRAAVEQFGALLAEIGKDHYLRAAAAFAEGEGRRELGDDARAAAAFQAAVEAAVGDQASFRFPALYQLGFAHRRLGALGPAAAAFEAAVECAPDAAAKGECRYLQGDALLRLQDYDGADRSFTAAGKFASEFADDAAFGLGWVALGRQDQRAASKAFARCLEQHPESPLAPAVRLELGRALYRDQRHGEAATALQPLLGDDAPAAQRAAARELAGLCALAGGTAEAALAHLQQALAAAAPKDRPRLCFALGEALANLGRWQEAAAAYDEVPGDAPAELRGDALYGSCYALHQLGQHEASNQRAEAVVELQPAHRLRAQAAFAIAENLFLLQRYEAAEKAYAALGNTEALRDKVEWKLAWCRYLRGDKKDAAARFAAFAGTDGSPFAEEGLAMTALCRLDVGDADGALAAADRYRARYRDGRFVDRTERVAARVLRQRGALPGAQKRLERAAAAAAASGAAAEAGGDLLERAELSFQQGDFRAADARFAELAERTDAIGARAAGGRAWCAFELGDDDGCATWLARATAHPAVGPALPDLLELQVALHHRRQQWAEARAVAEQFLGKFGKHGKAPAMRYSLGVAQARSGDDAAAKQTFEALQRDGGYERPDRLAYELAWAARRSGDEAAALRSFAVAAASGDAAIAGEANLHLGEAALGRKDLAAARERLDKVQGPHRARALYKLGFAEFEAAGTDRERLAAARDRFAELATLPDPQLAGEGLYLGAECCRRLGDQPGAIARLQQLLQRREEHERADRARLLLGECAVAVGDGNTAVRPLEEFLRGKDRERGLAAQAQLLLGRARLLRGEADKAEASLQKATELSDGPIAAEAQFRIGEARLQKGDLQGAADAFVKLPILYAHAEWVRQGLLQAGLVYERLQQPDKAQRFFQELCKQHAGSNEAATAKQHLRDG